MQLKNKYQTTDPKEIDGIVFDLQRLIRQPSISSHNIGIEECALLVMNIMRENGIPSRLLRLGDHRNTNRSRPAPLVFGEVKSKANPHGKTLLFYNHYDVQPVEPLRDWFHHPFQGKIEGDKISGRGASDDKGELITRIKAIGRILGQTGDVPCNVKFIVEGEEEIGSPHLKKYLELYSKEITCDAIIWEFGYVDERNRPIINLGMKGMLYVTLTAIGPSTDLHSSLGAIVSNPSWRLVKALGTLLDDSTGTITIRDWYEEVQRFSTEEVRHMTSQPPFDETAFKRRYGLKYFIGNKRDVDLKKALAGAPTCNISTISSGSAEEKTGSVKTILPSTARASIDFRLVPNMVPEIQFAKLKKHLECNGFGDISVKFVHGLPASRTSLSNPFVKLVRTSARAAFGQLPVVNISSSGSGPMSLVVNATRAPCVAAGCSHIYSNIHSSNEFALISLLERGTRFIIDLTSRFGQSR